MCGIIGLFNVPDAQTKITRALQHLRHRGRDGQGIATPTHVYYHSDAAGVNIPSTMNILGHCLHAIIGNVPQPLTTQGILAANCEIYNWKALAPSLPIAPRNDAELLLHLLETQPIMDVLHNLDGDYAFIYWNKDDVYLARDRIGVKPLWYAHEHNQFATASERKTLEDLGYTNTHELHPRTLLHYHIPTRQITLHQRPFYTITPEHPAPFEIIKEEVKTRLVAAVQKRIPPQPFGMLFSGGIDSALLAKICKDHNHPFVSYTAIVDEPTFQHPIDATQAVHAARALGIPHKLLAVTLNDVEAALPAIIQIIEDTTVTKVGVALPFYFASKAAAADGVKVLFSGLGSEELFAGYERHTHTTHLNSECLSGLRKLYERDLYRDDTTTMHHTVELRVPYLDHALIDYSLKIPARYKITPKHNKYILRTIARDLGVREEIAFAKKRAAQYGSNFDKAIKKLAKKRGYATTSAYLHSFSPKPNLKLGVLFSSGKDSTYALHIMHQQNYTISCLITLKSKNPDSYMFHTPNIDLALIQADALHIPVILQETGGEKEHELDDLKTALQHAKETYHIGGIVTGALASRYQRDRIEQICEDVGLKVYSPLWHKDQETELHELLANNYHIIISSVASEGLGKEWLGKKLTLETLEQLKHLHKKNGMNIAFEGGEAETLVLDAPLFKKRIIIEDAESLMYDTHSGIYAIKKVRLEEKD